MESPLTSSKTIEHSYATTVRKPVKILDLPLTTDQRELGSQLNLQIRKKGEFDRIRKSVFSDLQAPPQKEKLDALRAAVAAAVDREIDKRPDILSNPQMLGPLLLGAIERSGAVAELKPLLAQLLAQPLDEAEGVIRQLRKNAIGEDAYAREVAHCSKTDAEFTAEAEQRKVERVARYEVLRAERRKRELEAHEAAEEKRKKREEERRLIEEEREKERLAEIAEEERREAERLEALKPKVLTETEIEDLALQNLLNEGQKLTRHRPEMEKSDSLRRPIAPPSRIAAIRDPKLAALGKFDESRSLSARDSIFERLRDSHRNSSATPSSRPDRDDDRSVASHSHSRYDQYKPRYDSYRASSPARSGVVTSRASRRRSRDPSPAGADRYKPPARSSSRNKADTKSADDHTHKAAAHGDSYRPVSTAAKSRNGGESDGDDDDDDQEGRRKYNRRRRDYSRDRNDSRPPRHHYHQRSRSRDRPRRTYYRSRSRSDERRNKHYHDDRRHGRDRSRSRSNRRRSPAAGSSYRPAAGQASHDRSRRQSRNRSQGSSRSVSRQRRQQRKDAQSGDREEKRAE